MFYSVARAYDPERTQSHFDHLWGSFRCWLIMYSFHMSLPFFGLKTRK